MTPIGFRCSPGKTVLRLVVGNRDATTSASTQR
jgi:hypothetical protein